jgi:tetratricopeptide (TPR) repeat protein
MRAAMTVFSSALLKWDVYYRWTRTLKASNESWPTLPRAGSSYSIMPTTPISSWPRTYRRETEAISSSPAVILNISITTRWVSRKWLDSRSTTLYCYSLRRSPVRSTSYHELLKKVKQIVEVLGCHALAIVQAGAYIRETSCSLPDYLEIYQRRKKDLLEHLPTHLGTDYQNSVYATWQISVDMIESRPDTVSHSTLRLLSLLGFYHHDQIPVQMFYNAWHNLQADQDIPNYLPRRDIVSDLFDYRQLLQASITLLASFSLITRNADASLSLHPLVHEWCRHRMSKDEQQLSYRLALSLLTSSVECKFETEDYAFRRSLVSHVHELLRLRGDQGDLSEEEKMQAWPVLSLVLEENGWTKDAIGLIEHIVKLQKSNLGEDHPETLMEMQNLANQYTKAGRGVEGLHLAEEVLKLRKIKLGDDHPDTLMSMYILAIRYSEAGRRTEALQLTEEVLTMQKSKLGEDHPNTLWSMIILAIQYYEAGRRTEALQLTEEVVKLRKRRLGEDHPDTLASERLFTHLSQGTDETFSSSEASHRPRHSRLKFLQRLRSRRNK